MSEECGTWNCLSDAKLSSELLPDVISVCCFLRGHNRVHPRRVRRLLFSFGDASGGGGVERCPPLPLLPPPLCECSGVSPEESPYQSCPLLKLCRWHSSAASAATLCSPLRAAAPRASLRRHMGLATATLCSSLSPRPLPPRHTPFTSVPQTLWPGMPPPLPLCPLVFTESKQASWPSLTIYKGSFSYTFSPAFTYCLRIVTLLL